MKTEVYFTTATVWVAIHTDDPLDGTQDTCEVSYPGYQRLPLTSWQTKNDGDITTPSMDFPAHTNQGPLTVSHFSIGLLQEGPGFILTGGTVDPNIVLRENYTARLTSLRVARGIWRLMVRLIPTDTRARVIETPAGLVVPRYVRRYGQTEDMELSPPASV